MYIHTHIHIYMYESAQLRIASEFQVQASNYFQFVLLLFCFEEYVERAVGPMRTHTTTNTHVRVCVCVFVACQRSALQFMVFFRCAAVCRGVMRVNNSRKWKWYCCCGLLLLLLAVGCCVPRSSQLQNCELRLQCLIRIKSCFLLSKQHQKQKRRQKKNAMCRIRREGSRINKNYS